MKIKSVHIQNFRAFEDQTIPFDDHACLVGPNGAGKSTVLSALNVFFQEGSNLTSVAELTAEDFHNGNTAEPVQITVSFHELSDPAKTALDHYVRHGELVVTATAKFNALTGLAPVEQNGERLVFQKFAPWFDDDKNRIQVGPLRERFIEVTGGLAEFPNVGKTPTKAAMKSALRAYEEARPEICSLEKSQDLFYGSTRGKGILEPFIQWIYVPAVKDASEEGEEAGNTALGKLLQRTVRQKVNFDADLAELNRTTREAYDALLEREQGNLSELSKSLEKRLCVFAHPGAGMAVEWLQGSEKSVRIDGPRATIKAKEGKFKGGLVRFGHGLQRSFLLVILQELASVERQASEEGEATGPTLVLGIEEPELYQHPPQARHLSTELRALTASGNQVLITTHSPYFVSGEAFDEIRLIRKRDGTGASYATFTDFERFAKRIAEATGKKPDKPSVARAKLIAALRPEPAELYFCQKVALVEGLEDRAFIASALHCEGGWDDMRRAGLHVIPCDRKSSIIQLLAIAKELEIPSYVIFDADGHEDKEEHRKEHERDNVALLKCLGLEDRPFPDGALWHENGVVWPHTLEVEVKKSFSSAEWQTFTNEAKKAIDPGARLKKNPAFIGELVSLLWAANRKPDALTALVAGLKKFTQPS
jgi:energy-coupling factor transporter ATP-binding protein EcfA2